MIATLLPTTASLTAPFPSPGQINLHLLPLSCSPDRLDHLKRLLTPDESRRCNRLLDPQRRDRAAAGRGLLRELLGAYLDEEPGEILLSEGEFGKLHLSEHLEADSLTFNLSHAGNRMLVAISSGCEVGVDMELVRHDLQFRPMAERYFSSREQQELFSLPPDQQLAAFYRCWTRKEAYLKGTGSGFSQPSNGFDISLLPRQQPAILAHRTNPAEIGRWSIRDVAMPEGFCAAVAIERVTLERRAAVSH